MEKANDFINNERGDSEMMSDSTLQKLIEYLKKVGWTDAEIVKLLEYIASK